MKKFLHKISIISEKIETFLIMTFIILMMVNSTGNAIGRYVFNKSIFFSEELNKFLIIAVTFVGFAYAVRRGRNIRMTAIYDSLSTRAQKVLTTFISLASAILMFYLAYQAFLYVDELKSLNRLSPALQIPVFWVYAIIPIGLAIAGLQYAMSFIMNLLHKEIYVSFDVIETKNDEAGGM